MKHRKLIPGLVALLLILALSGCGSSPKAVLVRAAKAVNKAETITVGIAADANVTVDNPIYPLALTLSGNFDVTSVPEDGKTRIDGSVGTQIMKRELSFPLQAYATGADTGRSSWYVYFPLKGTNSRWQKLTVSSDKKSMDIKAVTALMAEIAGNVKLTETTLGSRECYKLTGRLTGAQLKDFDLRTLGYRIDSSATVEVSALLDRKTCAPIKIVLYSDDLFQSPIDFGEYVSMDLTEVSVTLNLHLDEEPEYIELPAEAVDADICTDLGDGLELKDSFRKLLGLG